MLHAMHVYARFCARMHISSRERNQKGRQIKEIGGERVGWKRGKTKEGGRRNLFDALSRRLNAY